MFNIMHSVQRAAEHIGENAHKVDQTYRLKFHLMPPIGWMNDPNGFSYYNGKVHLFYQHYPYEEVWNYMHWGHACTDDFVKWEHLPLALAPDCDYDKDGCFSGTAICEDGQQILMYTCVKKEHGQGIQQQAVAYSTDGFHYRKFKENPVIASCNLPVNVLPTEFRDPKLWKEDGVYYTAIVAKDALTGGRLLLYRSYNLTGWTYIGDLIEPDIHMGEMWECPDFFSLNNNKVVLLSIIGLHKEGYQYINKQSSVVITGSYDETNKKFVEYTYNEIDFGFDFYAPQTIEMPDGRRIMTAWMQAWEEEMPTQELKHGWAGAMVFPREIQLIEGKLIQMPVQELLAYRSDEIVYENCVIENREIDFDGINGYGIDMELEVDISEADRFILRLFHNKGQVLEEDVGDNATFLIYDKLKETLTFFRGGRPIKSKKFEKPDFRAAHYVPENNILKLRLLVDTCSVEIFAGKGELVMTNLVYPVSSAYGIRFSASGRAILRKICKWNIEI